MEKKKRKTVEIVHIIQAAQAWIIFGFIPFHIVNLINY